MYNIGDKFSGEYPPEVAIWCNSNNAHIEQVGDEFVIIENQIYIPTNEDKIADLQAYLNSTDWYIVRFTETGEPIPENIKAKRANSRIEISNIREGLN